MGNSKSSGYLLVGWGPEYDDGEFWREECVSEKDAQEILEEMLRAGVSYIHVDSCAALSAFRKKLYWRQWSRSPKGKQKSRRHGIRYRFKISPEEYDRLLADPCSICGDTATDLDHDRSCCPGFRSCGECIRGPLCRSCNTALGLFSDDPDRLRAAAIYIEERSAARGLAETGVIA